MMQGQQNIKSEPYSTQNTRRINECTRVKILERKKIKEEIKTITREGKWKV
jgi:hypothetical protein